MPVDVLKADEGATLELAGLFERPLMASTLFPSGSSR